MYEYPYEFKPEDAYRLARERNIQVRESGNELVFKTCPNCGSETNKKYKFSINMTNGKCHCKRTSCPLNAGGNMITLAKMCDFELTREVAAYHNLGKERDRKLNYTKFRQHHRESTDVAIKYLRDERGISEKICRKYEITSCDAFVAAVGSKKQCIVFPCRDENNVLVNAKYRPYPGIEEVKEFTTAASKNILFGMNNCEDREYLVITEGQIDSLSLAEAGVKNACSVIMGKNNPYWIPNCFDFMLEFEKIIIFGDNENGVITLVDMILKRIKKKPVYAVRPEDYLGCKDANEILLKHGKKALINAVENAKRMNSSRLVPVGSIKYDANFQKKRLQLGINAVDKILGGGLPFGDYHIIGAYTGEGKTTLASQYIANAFLSGFKSFVYSGELTMFDVQNALYKQIAGPNNLDTYRDFFNDIHYKVKQDFANRLSEDIGNNIVFYDTRMGDIEDEIENLEQIMDEAIEVYKTDVFLIDNLMTAKEMIDTEAYDLNDSVSKFVKRIRSFAMKNDVCIVLIAHKKKPTGNRIDGIDAIAGSADIGNLCSDCILYEKAEDIKENERLLKVVKNRGNAGKLNMNGIRISCEPKSLRLYSSDVKPNSNPFLDNVYAFEDSTEQPDIIKAIDSGFEAVEEGNEEVPF